MSKTWRREDRKKKEKYKKFRKDRQTRENYREFNSEKDWFKNKESR